MRFQSPANVESDSDDVTYSGRSFQICDLTIGKARAAADSLTVGCLTWGMS